MEINKETLKAFGWSKRTFYGDHELFENLYWNKYDRPFISIEISI